MLCRFALITALTLLSQPVWAFDTTVFQRQDLGSAAAASGFLALPAKQQQALALENSGADKQTTPLWQLFLLSWLSNQPQTAENWKQIAQAAYDRPYLGVADLPEAGQEASAALCFLQLQQPLNPALRGKGQANGQYAEQLELRQRLRAECVAPALRHVRQPPVFQWMLGKLEGKPDNERAAILQGGIAADALDAAQTSQLRETLFTQLVDADSGDTDNIATFLYRTGNDSLTDAWVGDVQAALPRAQPQQIPAMLETLVGVDNRAAADVFWTTLWQDPKRYFAAASTVLKQAYLDMEEAFPGNLHTSALARLEEQADVRFLATYVYLLITAEGSGWEHVADVIGKLDTLSATAPKDAETQAVLKYAYLQAAGFQYLDSEHRSLSQTLAWLDKAKAIPGEPLSWFLHASGETAPEERADQLEAFGGLQKLYDSGQLKVIVDWQDQQIRPAEPLRQLPLGVYSALAEKTVVARPWYDPNTGAALLLDDSGTLSYFDGFQLAADGEPFPWRRIDAKVETPNLRSPLEVWFAHFFRILTASADDVVAMTAFAKETRQADERLLVESAGVVETEGSDYLEYVRYGAEVLLNADVNGKVQQFWLTLPSAGQASAWLAGVAEHSAGLLISQPLWHWEGRTLYLRTRHYQHPDQEEEVILNPLYADKAFRYEKADCQQPLNPEALAQQAAAFAQEELALYRQGYVLTLISPNYDCVE